jgi:hypothetical protein
MHLGTRTDQAQIPTCSPLRAGKAPAAAATGASACRPFRCRLSWQWTNEAAYSPKAPGLPSVQCRSRACAALLRPRWNAIHLVQLIVSAQPLKLSTDASAHAKASMLCVRVCRLFWDRRCTAGCTRQASAGQGYVQAPRNCVASGFWRKSPRGDSTARVLHGCNDALTCTAQIQRQSQACK